MKVLIFINKNELKPVGGPIGYIYGLKSGLDSCKLNDIEIDYLDEEIRYSKLSELKKKLPKFAVNIFNTLYFKWLINSIVNSDGIYKNIDFSKYDIIHFHNTIDLYKCRNSIKGIKAKILLNSHSPKPAHQELVDGINSKNAKINEKYLKISERIDEYAFNNSDYIIFPCKEAEEPYYNRWKKYDSIKKNNISKYRYILTGSKEGNSLISKDKVRKKYHIPKNAIVISYVGRHNEVKGYDILKEIASKLLEKKEYYFLIAGQEGPMYHLENKKWIEVGWTKDPHSIIAASDLFVLPNRETYFDLILLEVLSLGVPTIVSYTGGNKYFKKIKSNGIEFFENSEDAVVKILNFFKQDKKTIANCGKNNKSLFNKYFTLKKFSCSYLDLLKKISKEQN